MNGEDDNGNPVGSTAFQRNLALSATARADAAEAEAKSAKERMWEAGHFEERETNRADLAERRLAEVGQQALDLVESMVGFGRLDNPSRIDVPTEIFERISDFLQSLATCRAVTERKGEDDAGK